jgi:hypothetical protein
VWAGITAILLILLGYRGTLTMHEEDQLFLANAGTNEEREQSALLLKVQKVTPYVRMAIVATCLMSAVIVAYYVWDAVKNLS